MNLGGSRGGEEDSWRKANPSRSTAAVTGVSLQNPAAFRAAAIAAQNSRKKRTNTPSNTNHGRTRTETEGSCANLSRRVSNP